MYWRLGDVTLRPGATERVLARFATDGMAAVGNVEARWEIGGGAGSGLAVSVAKAGGGVVDPFADEEGWALGGSGGAGAAGGWEKVAGERRLVSGTYVAV